MATPFNSELIIEERISETFFKAYYVGFDQGRFRLKELANVLTNVIPEFAFGPHEGSSFKHTQLLQKIREAAITIYDTDKYEKRGEFGEIVLHLLLRDCHGTIPLISKIYFKDSVNVAVHGFDGVHVTNSNGKKILWLGESKFYKDGEDGVKCLADDIKNHFQEDYLRKEFLLISRKLEKSFPDAEYWRKLMHENQKLETVFDSICVPVVCTYSSELYKSIAEGEKKCLELFEKECSKLKVHFEKHQIKTELNVILMLLPVSDKDELATLMNEKLKSMRSI
jgi:hypothetical protein